MPFDIYGQPLQMGRCEVHPHVWGEFPCSLCVTEAQQAEHQRDYDEERRGQWEEEMRQEMVDSWQGVGGDGI